MTVGGQEVKREKEREMAVWKGLELGMPEVHQHYISVCCPQGFRC